MLILDCEIKLFLRNNTPKVFSNYVINSILAIIQLILNLRRCEVGINAVDFYLPWRKNYSIK